MINDHPHKTAIQWAALVAAGALFWTILWSIGGQFRDHFLSDVQRAIAEHTNDNDRAAAAARIEFIQAIESEADNALIDIQGLQQSCAVTKARIDAMDAAISELNRWRSECGSKMASVQGSIGRDELDIRRLESRIDRIEYSKTNSGSTP